MITAVDTNVIVDVLRADATFGEPSAKALRAALAEGRLVACPVVWSELRAVFASDTALERAMAALRVEFDPLGAAASLVAGSAHRAYRRHGGKRTRTAPDFLVGGHASVSADRLISRDRGYFRAYFAGLVVIDPSASPPV